MSSPWSASRRVAPDASRLLIERAYEEFVLGNDQDARVGDVRGMVRESWRRSRDGLVGVEALPPLALSAEELERLRRQHPLGGVLEMIRALLIPGAADESGVIVAVGDASGRLLWVEGDRRLRSLTGEMGFVPGADWSEQAVGTAAPGTALALDRSVQIRGAEHFNRLVQPWSCTAAPVHDPETRRLLGVIDVTGGDPAASAQAQLLVDATARAVEGELLLARLRAREGGGAGAPASASRPRSAHHAHAAVPAAPLVATLRVLGRDRALLEIMEGGRTRTTELTTRHAELLLCLSTHRQGVSAERLGELVYGETDATATVRAEMVRLRKVLEQAAPTLAPESRPYRLTHPIETDAHQVLSLLDRGAHRVALAAYRGDVLPDSTAPGVEDFRATVRDTLREALMAEASIDVLLAFAETDAAADDLELLRLCLSMLPPRSPKRAGLVARVERLEA